MDPAAPNNREKEVFEQALDLASSAERLAFVKEACREDAALCARVLALLAAHEATGGFLVDKPEVATVVLPVTEKPGDRIGRYKLREKIGEGGCGLVYVAEQEEPVRRRVALKVIKLGMDTREVVARFEAERQALAMMDHPNIAKVLDAGATETGRPYFVMELVRGIRITDYCDQNKLSTQERLDLFIQVCHAIQHAHQKGIIHRDIKPSNVLVTLHDGVPVPKVIDFGIAKAMEQKLTEKTVYTAFEQFIGTPAYTSPEQAEMSGLDIDTRSDIYALGVLLYELLTGKTPFDGKELLASGLEAMRRTIREKEPMRPSTRLRTMLNGERSTTAERRRTEAPRLIHLLRGDLDWIVMKCLEKDRTRRYDTANGLAMDIERHLNSEPVVARPPSTAYRVQKFVRRNKVMVAAGTAVAVALVLGIAGSTWQAVRATRAESKAQQAFKSEAAQRQEAEKARANETQLRKQAQMQAYASDMKAAQVALQQNNRGMAVDLLRRYLPRTGEEDLRGLEWRYLWQESRSDELQSFPHPTMVDTAVLTPDGRYLATIDHGGTIRAWEVDSVRKILESEPRGRGGINLGIRLGCSADGRWMAAAGTDTVEIWDTTIWSVIRKLRSVTHPLRFSPDGRFLATMGTNGFWLWDLRDWTHRELTNTLAGISSLAFSPDGTRMVCASWGGQLQLWDSRTGMTNGLIQTSQPDSLEISPDGKWLACGSWRGEVSIWDLASQQLVSRFRAHPIVFALTFSPDSKRLATAGNDHLIQLWETGTTNNVGALQGHLKEIWSLGFSRDGQKLASSSEDGTAKLWSITGGQARSRTFTLPTNSVPEGPLPDGSALVTVDSKQRTTQLWSLPNGQLLRSFAWSQFEEKGCSNFWHLPANQVVIGQSTNGTVHFWSLRTGGHLNSVQLGVTNSEPVCLSPDNYWLLGTSPEGVLTLYDLRAARRVQQFEDYHNNYHVASFSPDGHLLAYGTTNYAVRIWDLAANRERTTLIGHNWFVVPIQFSPDGKLLASADWYGDVWLWSVASGKPLFPPLRGHQAGVKFAAFSSDGKTLVTASDDDATRWWSVATGKEMLLSENFRRVWDYPHVAPYAPWALGDKFLLREQPRGVIRVTTLPTLAEIDAAEAQARTAGQPKGVERP
jgi:WD40 repeat protein